MEELIHYIFNSDRESIKLLLDSGTNINIKSSRGVYPIVAAISSDDPKNLEFLIKNGADINVEYGLPLATVLDYCMDGMIQDNRNQPHPEAFEMLKIILENGADHSIRNPKGERPIDVLRAYAPKPSHLNKLKEIFRPVIQNIDELI